MKLSKAFLSVLLAFASAGAMAQINTVNPNQGNRGQTLPVIVSGNTNTFVQGSSTHMWIYQGTISYNMYGDTYGAGTGTHQINNITVVNSTTLTADVTIPTGMNLGQYSVRTKSGFRLYDKPNGFEVLGGTSTNSTLLIGGGRPGTTVQETFSFPGVDLSGMSVDQIWLSLNGNTITTLTNPVITQKTGSNVTVDIAIPVNAEAGYWSVNMIMSNGDIYYSPGIFMVDDSFSTEEVSGPAAEFYAYPNPARDFLNIDVSSADLTEVQIRIVDLIGKQRSLETVEVIDEKLTLNVSELPTGVYFVQIMNDQAVMQSIRWIKR